LLVYERETFSRATAISSSQECAIDEGGLTFEIEVPSHDSWSADVDVSIALVNDVLDQAPAPAWTAARRSRSRMEDDLKRWRHRPPSLQCAWDRLQQAYDQSLEALAALRFTPISAGRPALPAAGLPWFMTMFGRDSILTSLQTLPFTPEPAATTLREL